MKLLAIPPWEEVTYFQAPTVSIVTVGGPGQWTPLCKANPNRVVLWISPVQAIQVTPDPLSSLSTGIQLPTGMLPLMIREAQDGPLATSAWYAQSSVGNVSCTVIEVILREFPGVT